MSCRKTPSTTLPTPVSVAETGEADCFTYQLVTKCNCVINHAAAHDPEVLILKGKKDECIR